MQEVDRSYTLQVGLWERSFYAHGYIMPSLRIAAFTNMTGPNIMEERMSQLVSFEEYKFTAIFH